MRENPGISVIISPVKDAANPRRHKDHGQQMARVEIKMTKIIQQGPTCFKDESLALQEISSPPSQLVKGYSHKANQRVGVECGGLE